MYRNIHKYEIRYTDVDVYDNLKPSSLLSFLEESACFSADELGFGYNVISKKDLGFIVANWYLEFVRPVKLGEALEVHTWPLRPKYMIFLRDYELYSSGEKIGAGTSRWCMVDMKTFSMSPISAFFDEHFFDNYNTERSIAFNSWKIPAADKAAKIFSRKIALSDYDHYFHVNNTKYADFMLDAFTLEELKGKFIKRMQVTYVKQCKLGEVLDIYRQDVDGCIIVEGRVGDELRVQFKVETDEI